MNWPIYPLGEFMQVDWGNTSITKKSYVDEGFLAFSAAGQDGLLQHYEHEGDGIVVSAIGARCGKCFYTSGKWTAIKNTLVIKPKPEVKVSIKYLYYLLNDEGFWPKRGGAQPFITMGDARSIKISLPPLSKQEQIVSLMDKAEQVRKLRGQASARMEEFVPALFHEMFGDPESNPKKWPVVPVSSFVKEFQAGRSILTDGAVSEDTNYWVLKVSAVTWGEYNPSESKPVPKDYIPLPNHVVKAGDLLFSRANTTQLVGATVFVYDTPSNRLLSDKLWRFIWRKPDEIEPLFVWTLFQTKAIRNELGIRATGTGGSMKNISQPKVLSMPVPLPPLDLQREFAKRVQEARGVQSAQARSEERVEALYQSMLSRAFAGEL